MDFSDGKTTTTAAERIRARRAAARAAVMGDPITDETLDALVSAGVQPGRIAAMLETRTACERIRAARHGR